MSNVFRAGVGIAMMPDECPCQFGLIGSHQDRPDRIEGRHPHLCRAASREETENHLFEEIDVAALAPDICEFSKPLSDLLPSFSMGGDDVLDRDRGA